MRNEPDNATPAGGPFVRARCVWCGDVEFALGELGVHSSGRGDGLLEFACPSCGRLNVRALGGRELAVLDTMGARPSTDPAPFELLEKHAGPPIGWDDLIEFHQAISSLESETAWLRNLSGPGRDDTSARERDAA